MTWNRGSYVTGRGSGTAAMPNVLAGPEMIEGTAPQRRLMFVVLNRGNVPAVFQVQESVNGTTWVNLGVAVGVSEQCENGHIVTMTANNVWWRVIGTSPDLYVTKKSYSRMGALQ